MLLLPVLPQVAACMGKEGDATPFTSVTVDNISAALHRCALPCSGDALPLPIGGCACVRA